MKTVLLTTALVAAGFLARDLFADLAETPAPHMTYWRTGGPRTSVSMRDGVRWGPATEWYPDGTKQCEGTYVDGLREGSWNFWMEDGSPDPSRSGTYLAGRRLED